MGTDGNGLFITILGLVVVVIILLVWMRARNGPKKQNMTNQKEEAPGNAQQETCAAPDAPPHIELKPEYAYVPGPSLTRADDAFFAVVSAAIAQTLASEGINPEGGFAIRSIKPIEELGPKLTLQDSALYAVITAAIASALQDEGIDPEAGFTISSVRAI